MQKKKQTNKHTAALIIMHTRVSMWKFMNSVWNQKWVVWHVNIHMFYTFMNIPHWIPWKAEKFPSSFPVPCLRRNNIGKCCPLPIAVVI